MPGASRLSDLVRDGDRLLVGTGAGEPSFLIHQLLYDVIPYRTGLEIIQVTAGGQEELASLDVAEGHRLRFPAVGPKGHRAVLDGRAELFPASMSELDRLVRHGDLAIDGVLLACAPRPDGSLSPGLSLDVARSAAIDARFRAIEVNAAFPQIRSFDWEGWGEADLQVEATAPPRALARAASSPVQRRIAEYLASLVRPGAVLEIGLGSALNDLARAFTLAGRQSLSVHTGLVGNAAFDLVDTGVASVGLDCASGAKVAGTVVHGAPDVYAWADGTSELELIGSSHAQNVAHLASIEGFTAINSASEVDLLGRVGATTRSGVLGGGGLRDFATAGALAASSIIAIESRNRHDVSRIVPSVAHQLLGGPNVTHVVSEYGVARLRGRTAGERARAMVSIAHPDDRACLLDEWSKAEAY